jgi:hypothetical protein
MHGLDCGKTHGRAPSQGPLDTDRRRFRRFAAAQSNWHCLNVIICSLTHSSSCCQRRSECIVWPSRCRPSHVVAPSLRRLLRVSPSLRRHRRPVASSCCRSVRVAPSASRRPSNGRAVRVTVAPSELRRLSRTVRVTPSESHRLSLAVESRRPSRCALVAPPESRRHGPSRAVRVASGPSSQPLSRAIVVLLRRRDHPASRR